jgi:hypothetical protein
MIKSQADRGLSLEQALGALQLYSGGQCPREVDSIRQITGSRFSGSGSNSDENGG